MRLRTFGEARELTSPFAVELRLRCIVLDAAAQLGHGHDATKAFADVHKRDAFAEARARPTDRLASIRRTEEEQNLLHSDDTEHVIQAALHHIDGVIHDAMVTFSTSAIMHVFLAHYVGAFKHNKHLERVHLAAAAQRADQLSFDCRWFAYVRNLQIQQDDADASRSTASGTAAGGMTVVRRMQYERLLELSRAQVTETRAMMLSFWEQLAGKHPDLKRLQMTGVSITAALTETDTTFQYLLDLAPQSATVMRLYADFLLELANDPVKGRELLTDAETLEDEQSRVRTGANSASDAEIPFGGPCAFDMSAESLATVRVSAEPGKLGIITDCNAAFMKIIGYNRRELIGREMSFIIPEPMGSIHPLYLERYQSTGVERVVNRSRSLFCAHRGGYIVPVKANIRPTGDSFVAVMELMVSPLSYLFFLGEPEGWRVASVCKSSLSLLGIDVALLKAGKVSMTAFLNNVAADVERLLAAADGLTIRLGSHKVNAKLQSVSVPHVPTPLHILRYRIISGEDRSEVISSLRYNAGTIAEDGENSDANSDRASGSGSDDEQPVPVSLSRMGSKRSFRMTGKLPAGHAAVAPDADISLCPVIGKPSTQLRTTKSSGSLQHDGSNPQLQLTTVNSDSSLQLPGSTSEDGPLPLSSPPIERVLEVGPPPILIPGPPPHILAPVSPRTGNRRDPLERMVTDTEMGSARVDDAASPGVTVQSAMKRARAAQSSSKLRQSQPVRFSSHDEHGNGNGDRDGDGDGSRSPTRTRTITGGMTPVGMTPGGMSQQFTGVDAGTAAAFSGSRGSVSGPAAKALGPGSVQSADSANSGASEILRRGVLRSSARLEGSLGLLRRSLLLVFVVIAALNIAAVSVTTSLFQQMEKNTNLVVMNGDRALYMNRAYAHLQSLVFSAEGKFTIPEGVKYVQAKLEKWTSNFERLHRQLYLAVDDSLEEEHVLYTSPTIEFDDLIPGAYVNVTHFEVVPRRVSLVNAGLEMVAKLRLANSMTPANISMANDDVFFVMYNGHSDMRTALNESLMFADARSRSHADNVLLANIVVCAVAEIMLVAIVLVIVIPSVNQVIRSKNMIFFTFLEVPLPVIRALKRRVQKKIEALQQAADNDDHTAIDFDFASEYAQEQDAELKAGAAVAAGVLASGSQLSDSEMHASRSPSGMPASLLEAQRGSTSSFGGSARSVGDPRTVTVIKEEGAGSRWCGSRCGCCSRLGASQTLHEQAATRRAKHKRRYSNMRTSSFTVLLSMVWPLVVFMAYFGATFAWKQSVVEEVKYVRDEILWTMQQRFYLGEIDFNLRDGYAYCDPGYVTSSLNSAEHAMNQMEYLTDSLMYGSAAMHLRAGVQISPVLAHIALVDGCVDHVGEYYNISQCQRTFYDGIFSKGLIQGFKEFAHNVRVLVLQRRAALAQDPSGASLCADPTATGLKRYPLNDEIIDAVDQMRWRYLAAVTNAAAAARLESARVVFADFASYDLGLTLACIAALGLFYFTSYSPLIRRLDFDIKQVRHLLLLFPDEVTRAVPAMVDVGRVLLRDNASVRSA